MIGKTAVCKVLRRNHSITRLDGILEDINKMKPPDNAPLDKDSELRIISEHVKNIEKLLKILLEKSEKEQNESKDKIAPYIRLHVLHYLKELNKTPLNDTQKRYIQTAITNIEKLSLPVIAALDSPALNLTHNEVRVATLIKKGKSSKEIADILNLSKRTIDYYRSRIRKKLGVKNKKANLQLLLRKIGPASYDMCPDDFRFAVVSYEMTQES